MKGDIAQRSIRSSMSRIVEARLPRMISNVTGSTTGRSGMIRTLHHEVVAVVHPRPEAGRHQARGVVLVHDGGPVEGHPGGEVFARIHRRLGDASAPEIDGAR